MAHAVAHIWQALMVEMAEEKNALATDAETLRDQVRRRVTRGRGRALRGHDRYLTVTWLLCQVVAYSAVIVIRSLPGRYLSVTPGRGLLCHDRRVPRLLRVERLPASG